MRLLDEGATVPFIARYRKEATGGLDDVQLRELEERLGYLRELEDRRAAVLARISEQGKLTDELAAAIGPPTPSGSSKTSTCRTSPSGAPRRRSPAKPGWSRWPTGCSPTRRSVPDDGGRAFVAPTSVADAAAALDGARDILVERCAEDADLVGALREASGPRARCARRPSSDAVATSAAAQKFRDYFDYSEPLAAMPSHRVLAVLRGEKEGSSRSTLDGGDGRQPYHGR